MSRRHLPFDGAPDEKYNSDVSGPVDRAEKAAIQFTDDDGELLLAGTRQRAERQLVLKLDLRLLPTIVLVFILNYIDASSKLHKMSYLLSYI